MLFIQVVILDHRSLSTLQVGDKKVKDVIVNHSTVDAGKEDLQSVKKLNKKLENTKEKIEKDDEEGKEDVIVNHSTVDAEEESLQRAKKSNTKLENTREKIEKNGPPDVFNFVTSFPDQGDMDVIGRPMMTATEVALKSLAHKSIKNLFCTYIQRAL